jgi:polyphosphate kinase 2 (PPK2 family)
VTTLAKSKVPAEKLKRKEYDKALGRLHVELVRLQEWVKHKGLKVCVVFEGRDGAGKGGTIKAITERVMGFCSDEQAKAFLKAVPEFEKMMVASGIILIKYWLEVSMQEQTRRLASRIDDGRKIWKLAPMDLLSYSR